MLSEVSHLQDVVDDLRLLSQDPSHLPESTEQTITDVMMCDVIQPSDTLEQKVDL